MAFAGGRLTVVLSILLVAMSAAVLAVYGTGADGVAVWVRATARSSVLLFMLAYVARPLRQLWRSDTSGWLVRNRRGLGVSMAVSHGLHLIAIIWYFNGFERPYQVELLTLVFGGAGFVFIALMALTSTDGWVARLGRERWQWLHRSGLHYVWFIFAFTFLGPFATGEALWLYGPIMAALACGPALRLAVWLRARRKSAATA